MFLQKIIINIKIKEQIYKINRGFTKTDIFLTWIFAAITPVSARTKWFTKVIPPNNHIGNNEIFIRGWKQSAKNMDIEVKRLEYNI